MQLPVGVEDLDRVLDRDDVLVARPVDVVDDRGERRRLAGAGGAGDEDEAAVLLGEPLDAGRHVELVEARDATGDDAERERDRAALPEGVDAEARPGGLVRGVELAGLAERRQPVRHGSCRALEHRLELPGTERVDIAHRLDAAVDAQHRRAAKLQMQVARAGFDSAAPELVDVHASRIGAHARTLRVENPRTKPISRRRTPLPEIGYEERRPKCRKKILVARDADTPRLLIRGTRAGLDRLRDGECRRPGARTHV